MSHRLGPSVHLFRKKQVSNESPTPETLEVNLKKDSMGKNPFGSSITVSSDRPDGIFTILLTYPIHSNVHVSFPQTLGPPWIELDTWSLGCFWTGPG